MSRIAYVDGRYLRYAEARVPIDDRGYQFGDGIYEVCEIRDGALIDETRHLARFERSLAALRIRAPTSLAALRFIMREIVARNRVRDGIVYVQATRGAARRDHGFPEPRTRPGLVVTARAIDRQVGEARAAKGVRVISAPDLRWARPDIKSLQLLPNVLAKQAARRASDPPGGSGDFARRHAHELARPSGRRRPGLRGTRLLAGRGLWRARSVSHECAQYRHARRRH
jgi:D-alanine transaminase